MGIVELIGSQNLQPAARLLVEHVIRIGRSHFSVFFFVVNRQFVAHSDVFIVLLQNCRKRLLQ